MADVLEPFIRGLTNPQQSNEVTLFNFDEAEKLSSPRSLAAVRCEGLVVNDLMSLSPSKLRGSANFQLARQRKWDEQRARHLEDCKRRYRALEQEAGRVLRDRENNNMEEALLKRERQQKVKEERICEVKAKLLDRMIDEQLRLQQVKTNASCRVQEKERIAETKRLQISKRLRERSEQKLLASTKKRAGVEQAARQALEETERRRKEREEAAHQAHERMQEARTREVEERRQRATEKKEQIQEKQQRCVSEKRARVVRLLEKREETEQKLQEILKGREEGLQLKAENIALRTMTIQAHVSRRKAQDEVNKERAQHLIDEKCKRADRLAAMRDRIKLSQAAIDMQDREKRKAVAQWKTVAEVTGDFTVPEWMRDPASPAPPSATKKPALMCIRAPEREYHATWMYNSESS